ncbi:Uncharacterised protein [Paucimonas lemoignei]|nr:Uncharacterised protein [Paucimonas lemoignei]
MLAKGPVHSAHLPCQIHSLREQARSHGFGVSQRFENTHRTCGSKLACEGAGTFSTFALPDTQPSRARWSATPVAPADLESATDFGVSHRFENTHRTCGSKLACEEAGTFSTFALPDTQPSRARWSATPVAPTDLRIFTESADQPRTCGSKLACEGNGEASRYVLGARPLRKQALLQHISFFVRSTPNADKPREPLCISIRPRLF